MVSEERVAIARQLHNLAKMTTEHSVVDFFELDKIKKPVIATGRGLCVAQRLYLPRKGKDKNHEIIGLAP